MDCLIAIPCFRESERLPPFLYSLCRALAAASFTSQVLVVDDGSGAVEAAATRAVVLEAQRQWPGLVLEPLLLPENRGKGGAVYAGWQSCTAGEAALLCFVDADGSVPAAEVVRLVARLHGDPAGPWSALFGIRVKMLGARVTRVATRHYIGRVFATLAAQLTGLQSYDSQCGLKVVRHAAFQQIAGALRETRFVFDVELTLHLLRAGLAIREVPIDWREIPGSKVRVVRDSVRMAGGLLRIRRSLRAAERSSRAR